MKWFGLDDDGQFRLFGLPVSGAWRGDSDSLLDGFEPENPSFLVPRKYGLGWTVNLGAVAVKAGWIRPDDSLPDLAAHIPHGLRKALAIAPTLGGLLVMGEGVAVARQSSAATRWSLTGKPSKFGSGTAAALPALTVCAIVAAVPHLLSRRAPESAEAVAVNAQAELLGVETMSAVALLASYRSAVQPQKRQMLAVLAPVLWPVVAGCVQLVCVKSALSNIATELPSQEAKEGPNHKHS